MHTSISALTMTRLAEDASSLVFVRAPDRTLTLRCTAVLLICAHMPTYSVFRTCSDHIEEINQESRIFY